MSDPFGPDPGSTAIGVEVGCRSRDGDRFGKSGEDEEEGSENYPQMKHGDEYRSLEKTFQLHQSEFWGEELRRPRRLDSQVRASKWRGSSFAEAAADELPRYLF